MFFIHSIIIDFCIYLHKWILYFVNSDLYKSILSQLSYTPISWHWVLSKIYLFKFISQCYYLPTCVFMYWRVSKYLRTSLIMMSIVSKDEIWLSCCPLEWRKCFNVWLMPLLYYLCRAPGYHIYSEKQPRAHYPRSYNKLLGRYLAFPICSCWALTKSLILLAPHP